MPYLSRIRINPRRAAARNLIASPQAMHAAVQSGLPGEPSDERTLWRLDGDNPHRPHLFVLTQSRPDWNHLVEQAGWPDADGEHYAVRDYTPVLQQLALGREFAFRLTASPVQNTNRPIKPTKNQRERLDAGYTRSFRIGHRTATAQLQWLLDRTGRCGFTIPPARLSDAGADHAVPGLPDSDAQDEQPRDVRLIRHQRHSFDKGPLTKDQRVVMQAVTFEGRLQVTDPQLLTQHLLGGIGPSKAYGCGLLTVAPLATGR